MGRPVSIEYRFLSEEFRILREMKDSEDNVVDARTASAEETMEVDFALIDDIIDFAEQEFSQLFLGMREMSMQELQETRNKLERMRELCEAYIGYRDLQE